MTPKLLSLLADLVVETVTKTINMRESGHCIRIDELPASLASEACERLQALVAPPHTIRLVTSAPETTWQVTPTQAVTLRNEEELRVTEGTSAA